MVFWNRIYDKQQNWFEVRLGGERMSGWCFYFLRYRLPRTDRPRGPCTGDKRDRDAILKLLQVTWHPLKLQNGVLLLTSLSQKEVIWLRLRWVLPRSTTPLLLPLAKWRTSGAMQALRGAAFMKRQRPCPTASLRGTQRGILGVFALLLINDKK
jgi:hypothetical protein